MVRLPNHCLDRKSGLNLFVLSKKLDECQRTPSNSWVIVPRWASMGSHNPTTQIIWQHFNNSKLRRPCTLIKKWNGKGTRPGLRFYDIRIRFWTGHFTPCNTWLLPVLSRVQFGMHFLECVVIVSQATSLWRVWLAGLEAEVAGNNEIIRVWVSTEDFRLQIIGCLPGSWNSREHLTRFSGFSWKLILSMYNATPCQPAELWNSLCQYLILE